MKAERDHPQVLTKSVAHRPSIKNPTPPRVATADPRTAAPFFSSFSRSL